MEIAEEIGVYLDNEGIAELAVDLFLNRVPESPAKCVAVLTTSGPSTSAPIPKRLGIQILVRAEEHDDALPLVWLIYNKLHNKWNILPESQGRMLATTLPGLFYFDHNNWVIYSTNYVVEQAFKKV